MATRKEMTEYDRQAMIDVFRSMLDSVRPPESKTAWIYADLHDWDGSDVEACLNEARRQHLANEPLSERILRVREAARQNKRPNIGPNIK